ncbi:MAG: universal stress protein [Bifidobacterium tibiigranuli]|uniref:universal stress protein n=1 Tax=Bifidobacterium tibiigranuli TaxID=2172043 RepID=UPI0026EF75C3|nr:universal stress protein [Bifidobacterium tibiigranuli]MCI1673913.1 universal stress protein [Bifidobacterium tibiigranuli]MCI1712162.1 universal stress protein [Bifidobacterium tibiigranuli]MCI1834274.1 universal stress protein [Bifidobacterium tibiigranuli]
MAEAIGSSQNSTAREPFGAASQQGQPQGERGVEAGALRSVISHRVAIVGIAPDQPDLVMQTALRWAKTGLFDRLIAVYVDPTLIQVDGHWEPLDPDSLDEEQRVQAFELGQRIDRMARRSGFPVTFRRLGGDPMRRLSDEAKRADAKAIIVGTREHGPVAAVEEWLRGSISVRLEHSQSVPVVVIPLGKYDNDTGAGGAGADANGAVAGIFAQTGNDGRQQGGEDR